MLLPPFLLLPFFLTLLFLLLLFLLALAARLVEEDEPERRERVAVPLCPLPALPPAPREEAAVLRPGRAEAAAGLADHAARDPRRQQL